MRFCVILLLTVLVSKTAYSQFPYVAGKDGNGTFYTGETVGLINYDFGSSRIGFSRTEFHQIEYSEGSSGFPKYWNWNVNLGLAANENTFVVFSEDFKPGFDFSFDFLRGSDIGIKEKKYDIRSTNYYLRFISQSKQLKYLDTLLVGEAASYDKTKWDVGINFGASWTPEKEGVENSRWYFSLGGYAGYSFRNEGELKEMEVQSISGTSGSYLIKETEKRYVGSPENVAVVKLFVDYGFRIVDLYNKKEENDPSVRSRRVLSHITKR